MSLEDRDWYRKDYERRRKLIEEEEKRKARQAGVDTMWNEVERPKSKPQRPQKPNKQAVRSAIKEKQLLLTCPNCEKQFTLKIKAKHITSNSCRCPNCNRVITIKCEKAVDRALTLALYIIGTPALMIVVLFLINSIVGLFI